VVSLSQWGVQLLGRSIPVKKFPTIFGSRRFITAVTSAHQLDPAHTPKFHVLRNHLNIILPSTPVYPKWRHSLRFPHLKPEYTPPLPLHATCPAHLILEFIARAIFGEQYHIIKLLII
jgi:hypothetical protein